MDTSPNLLFTFICVEKWLMCFLHGFRTLLRVDVTGGCGFVTQSSQRDSSWLPKQAVLPYCPPSTAIVWIQTLVWSCNKSVQGVTPHKAIHVLLHGYVFSWFIFSYWFILGICYKLYPAKKINAEKSSELHFYIHFIARSVKDNNNNNRTKTILSTVQFFK